MTDLDGENGTFWIGGCDCSSSGCASFKAQPAALTYELAISESGGPYTVFATLQQGDLVNHQYTHQFSQPYQSGMVRLRVLNGTTVVDEAFLLYPITIEPNNTAAPPAAALQQPLHLTSAPNPFTSETVLSFALVIDQTVEAVVYDAAGRRVATLHAGRMGPGQHEVAWNGRLDDGTPAASGIYHCAVRTPVGTATKTLAKIR